MAQVRLDVDVEELVRDWAEEHDVSLSAAVNGMLREWDQLSYVDTPPAPPARASVRSARGSRSLRRVHGLG